MIKTFEKIYFHIMQNGFVRHVFLLSGASVFAQIINIALMPVLSRLYSPKDFGVLALFGSVVSLLATVSGFRYYLVLPLARRESCVYAIVWLSVLLQITFTLIIVFMVLLFGDSLNGTRYKVLFPYRYIIPLCVLAIGMYSMAVQWAVREKMFSLIAKTKLTQVLTGSAIKIGGAFIYNGPLWLLLGYVAAQSCGGITLIRHLIQSNGIPHFNLEKIKRVALHYRNMCLIDTPGALLNMAGAHMLPLVIAYFYADDVVGSFSMAQNLLILPSVIVGQAIGQVFSQRAAEAYYNGALGDLTGKTFEILARCGLFPVLLCSLFALDIFEIALGANWRKAGYFASLLGPWIAVNFIYSPMSVLFTTLMIQRTALAFTSVYTITRLCSVVVWGTRDPSYAILMLSVTGTVMMLIGVIILMLKAGVVKIGSRIIKVFGETLIALIPSAAFSVIGENNLVFGSVALATSLVVYCWFIVKAYKR